MLMLTCKDCGNDDNDAIMGHQERGVYDGILWWECLMCGFAWARDFGEFYGRRNDMAVSFVAKHNNDRRMAKASRDR